MRPIDYFDEPEDVPPSTVTEDAELCEQCGAPLDDGEGWDGLCGSCADMAENEDPYDGF